MARPPCSIEGCESESKGRGWCGKHYQRWKKHGSPTPEGVEERDMSHGPCAVEGCPRDRAKKGLCGLHYQRYRIHGDTTGSAYGAPRSEVRRRVSYSLGRRAGCHKESSARGVLLLRRTQAASGRPRYSARKGRSTRDREPDWFLSDVQFKQRRNAAH